MDRIPDDAVERDSVGALEAAFETAAGTPTARVPLRIWLSVGLPLLGALVGAIAAVAIGSVGSDAVWVFLLLPYIAVIGALGGAIVGGVAAAIVFRVLRR